MAYITDLQALASGYDNIEDLTPLHLLSPPLFYDFRNWVNQEFSEEEGLTTSGSRRIIKIGLPVAVWTFASLTVPEFVYLRSDWVTGADALVTVRTLDTSDNLFKNYNAIMERPTGTYQGAFWSEVRITFRDMRELA